jgi:signal transduction histidine kinase
MPELAVGDRKVEPGYLGLMAVQTEAISTSPSASPAIALPRQVIEIAAWLFMSAPIMARQLVDSDAEFLFVDVLAAALSLVLIMFHRRWPIPALALTLVALLGVTLAVERPTALLPTAIVLLFGIAVTSERAVAVRAGLAVLVAVLVCVAVFVSKDFFGGPELLAGLAWPALAVAAGQAVRSRREAIAAADERAARAEASREEEARRRVVEERLHIARELHDVIAHKIAVVNVQAGVASHLVHTKPDEASTALAIVRSSAREILDELGGMLGVLRSDDESPSTEPTPTLDDVAALVDSFEAVGLHVTYQTSGSPTRVSDAVAIAAYRTVQEALTNAHKHGDDRAQLRISYERDSVTLVITNRLRTPTSDVSTSGYGLIGMRERAHAAGGEVAFGPQPDGTFVVRVHLPTRAAAR